MDNTLKSHTGWAGKGAGAMNKDLNASQLVLKWGKAFRLENWCGLEERKSVRGLTGRPVYLQKPRSSLLIKSTSNPWKSIHMHYSCDLE